MVRVMRRSYSLRWSAVCMRLHSYRDENHARHFDLIGAGIHPWSIDLVYVTVCGILVVGFVCALMANLLR
jgi:hypothetical protein